MPPERKRGAQLFRPLGVGDVIDLVSSDDNDTRSDDGNNKKSKSVAAHSPSSPVAKSDGVEGDGGRTPKHSKRPSPSPPAAAAGPALNDTRLRGAHQLLTLESARFAVRLVADFVRDEEAGRDVTFARALFVPLWRRLRDQGRRNPRVCWRYEPSRDPLAARNDVFVPPNATSTSGARGGAGRRLGKDYFVSEEHVALSVLEDVSTLEEVSDLFAENAQHFTAILPVLDRAVTKGTEYKYARRQYQSGGSPGETAGSASGVGRRSGSSARSCNFQSFGMDCALASDPYELSGEEKSLAEEEKCSAAGVGKGGEEEEEEEEENMDALVKENANATVSGIAVLKDNDEAMASNLAGVEPKVFMPIEILDEDLIWNMGQIMSISYGTDIVQEKAKGKQNGEVEEVEASSPKCLVTIRYEGWGKEWDETLPFPNNRLSRMFTYTKKVKCFVTMLGSQKHSPPQTGSAELTNSDILNWTDAWPCAATFRMPHPGQARTSDAFACLRGRGSRIFVRPYLAYLVPKAVQRRMLNGGQWVDVGKLLPWMELDLNDPIIAPSGDSILRELPHAGAEGERDTAAGTAYCFVHDFCQAYRAARSDWIKGRLPPNAVLEGALLRDEYRVRNVSGDAIGGVRYSGSFDVSEVEVKEVKANEIGKNNKKCPFPTTNGDAKRGSNQGYDVNAVAKSEDLAHPSAMKVPFVHTLSLPPPIRINDVAYPDQGVRRLPDSNLWASILRVGANDIFLGSYTSQSEAAYTVKLASAQSERENSQVMNGTANSSKGAPLTPYLPNFQVYSPLASNAGRIADLFNTPIESIVSAFEETHAVVGQDKPSRPRFRLRDWMEQHYRMQHQHLKELSPMSGQDVSDHFFFVTNLKEDGVRRKRRKQSAPKRLRVPTTDGEQNKTVAIS